MFDNISIIHKTYKFYLLLYASIAQFPKRDRYTIGQKCEQVTLEILELLFMANSQRGEKKMTLLSEIDVKLKVLKTLIRLAYDVKAINEKHYLILEEKLQEVGKMLGGWMKQTGKENLAVKEVR